MSQNIMRLIKLSELVSLTSLRKPKIVIDPSGEYRIGTKKENIDSEDWDVNIICDKTSWKLPEKLEKLVDEIAQDDKLSNEDKILCVFDKLGHEYIYDDNILSYMRKLDDDKFALPDWYGRDIDMNWTENREEHNRRVCYEISRYLAKSLDKIFKNDEKINTCILWDVDLTHYYVGLISDEYALTLDLDNFDKIKDLTRIKAGLTAEGISILEDNNGRFKKSLDKYNEGKSKYAYKKISSEVEDKEAKADKEEKIQEPDDVTFLRNAVKILKEQYGIDSQGIFEYMKEIVDIKMGPDRRKKIWKKIEGNKEQEKRYIRCLTFNIGNQEEYVIDVDTNEVRPFNKAEFEVENSKYIPYKQLLRDWEEQYNGR